MGVIAVTNPKSAIAGKLEAEESRTTSNQQTERERMKSPIVRIELTSPDSRAQSNFQQR